MAKRQCRDYLRPSIRYDDGCRDMVDIDPRNGGDQSLARYPLPVGPTVLTGGGGRHHYCAGTLPKIGNLLPGVDLQGEGALAILPPSIHPNGTPYRWARGRALGEVPLRGIPSWLRQLVREHQEQTIPTRTALPSLALKDTLARLERVRECGNGWIARCPAHADDEPSLSIAVGEKVPVVFHCHAGCDYARIRTALETRRSITCP